MEELFYWFVDRYVNVGGLMLLISIYLVILALKRIFGNQGNKELVAEAAINTKNNQESILILGTGGEAKQYEKREKT